MAREEREEGRRREEKCKSKGEIGKERAGQIEGGIQRRKAGTSRLAFIFKVAANARKVLKIPTKGM